MSIQNSSCTFIDYQVKSGLTQKRKLGSFVNQMIYYYTQKQSIISYIFSDDDFVLRINKDYLNHDTYTDIITFDLSEKKSNIILSDIYISIDRVKENAMNLKSKFNLELLRVILHGALHLSGFKDKTKAQKLEMRAKEDEWITKFLTLQ